MRGWAHGWRLLGDARRLAGAEGIDAALAVSTRPANRVPVTNYNKHRMHLGVTRRKHACH